MAEFGVAEDARRLLSELFSSTRNLTWQRFTLLEENQEDYILCGFVGVDLHELMKVFQMAGFASIRDATGYWTTVSRKTELSTFAETSSARLNYINKVYYMEFGAL
jgi:hypothetical protein